MIQATSKSVKVYSWMSAMTYAGISIFGPEKLGGKGNLRVKIEEEVGRTGKPFGDVAVEVCPSTVILVRSAGSQRLQMSLSTTDDIVRLPGMPPTYEYEQLPQDVGSSGIA